MGLFSRKVKEDEHENFMVHYNLGNAYAAQGRLDAAVGCQDIKDKLAVILAEEYRKATAKPKYRTLFHFSLNDGTSHFAASLHPPFLPPLLAP